MAQIFFLRQCKKPGGKENGFMGIEKSFYSWLSLAQVAGRKTSRNWIYKRKELGNGAHIFKWFCALHHSVQYIRGCILQQHKHSTLYTLLETRNRIQTESVSLSACFWGCETASYLPVTWIDCKLRKKYHFRHLTRSRAIYLQHCPAQGYILILSS